MYYRHNLNYEYPDRCDEHMIKVKRTRDVKLDENYPYLQKGFLFKLLRVIYWLAVNCIVFLIVRFSHGLKIHGKKNLKKHKEALKHGAITVSNHVFMWDFLCVLKAIRPHLEYFPAWKTNLEGSNAGLVRMSGGIPVPTDSIHAMMKFKGALEEVLSGDNWVHFFAEGSLWFYYPDIRPLKIAAFRYAVKYNKPIVPISMSFRPRRGIWKLMGKKPLIDLHVGKPVFADPSLKPSEAAEKLRAEVYHTMQVMNGINPGDPTYNTDQNPDTYKKTM